MPLSKTPIQPQYQSQYCWAMDLKSQYFYVPWTNNESGCSYASEM